MTWLILTWIALGTKGSARHPHPLNDSRGTSVWWCHIPTKPRNPVPVRMVWIQTRTPWNRTTISRWVHHLVRLVHWSGDGTTPRVLNLNTMMDSGRRQNTVVDAL